MSSPRADFWWGVLLIVLAALSWSTAGLFPRLVQTDMHTTLLWRSALGGATVFAAHALAQRKEGLSELLRLGRAELVMALFSAAAMICFVSAFYFAPVADVAFVYGAFPIVTLLLGALFLRQPIRLWDIACSVAVVGGMAIILGGQPTFHSAVGTLLSLLATLLFAGLTVGIKRWPGASMVKVTWAGAFLSAIVMLPFSNPAATGTHDLLWLWLYGFVNIGVGFGFYLLGVRKLKPLSAALLCMLEIPLAPLWAWAIFGDGVRSASLIGGTVVLLAAVANLLVSANPQTRVVRQHDS